MSDIHEEPTEDEITYPDAREDQAEFQGLLDEKDDDFQEAIDAQRRGEEPDEDRPNAAMP
jgi:hypothetical protein